jgi:N-acetylneuraminic acid mutarotase
MKKNLLILILILGAAVVSEAQYIWTQRADIGVTGRECGTGFAAGQMGYVGIGRNLETQTILQDFWRYDPSADTWTQVASFGGVARYAASCFVINDTAYVGLGCDDNTPYHFVKDFWKYNHGNNTWTQIADFGGNARYSAPAFAIGNNGYVGTGWDQVTPWYSDFWEYNSLTDTWTQKATYAGGARQSGVGFSIGNFGYMGTGWVSGSSNDFYKYDPLTDNWSQIANLPTQGTSMVSFVLNGEGYVGTGSITYPAVNFMNQFWRYTPSTDTWTAIANCGPTPRYNAVAFTIDSIAYCGAGGYMNFNNHDTVDFWRYAPQEVSVHEMTGDISIAVYPNPVTDKLNITSESNNPLQIIFYDMTGEKVLQHSFICSASINTSRFARGIYFYVLKDRNKIMPGKLIKQ